MVGIIECLDFWGRSIEDRYGAAPIFGVPIHIRQRGWQQAIA